MDLSERKLYKWQKEAIERFKDARAFMLNVCCGGGKTLVAIKIALYKKLPTLVIAPKRLCLQWKDDLMVEGVAEKDIWVYDQPEYSKDKKNCERRFESWLMS